jgi:hypothetical protein
MLINPSWAISCAGWLKITDGSGTISVPIISVRPSDTDDSPTRFQSNLAYMKASDLSKFLKMSERLISEQVCQPFLGLTEQYHSLYTNRTTSSVQYLPLW